MYVHTNLGDSSFMETSAACLRGNDLLATVMEISVSRKEKLQKL